MSLCDCGTSGCDPCVCGHPWSDHEGRPECLGDEGHCMCAKFDPKFKPHFFMPASLEHATSNVPDEWQGLPDYLLDELESPS